MKFLRPLCVSVGSHLSPLLAATAMLAAATVAQIPVDIEYGYHSEVGATIAKPYEVDSYRLTGTNQPQQGDLLRVTFSSVNTGSPYYTRLHQLEVWDQATSLGKIVGGGVLTVTLPRSGPYMITVQAQNSQSTGWYAFQVNRLNNPVGADRIGFNWHLKGQTPAGITATAGFVVYTLRAEAGSSALLRFTSVNTGSPYYTCLHYAELVDSAGKRVGIVNGCNAAGSPVSFQSTGVYTLFVAAMNYESTGWFDALVGCRYPTFSTTPCDTVAYSGNYGVGLTGTKGVPTLTMSALPKLGKTASIDVGNSYGQSTFAVLAIGVGSDNWVSPQFGGMLLVAEPAFLGPFTLDASGRRITFHVDNNTYLLGFALAAQSFVADTGASKQVAFSRGLLMLLGN